MGHFKDTFWWENVTKKKLKRADILCLPFLLVKCFVHFHISFPQDWPKIIWALSIMYRPWSWCDLWDGVGRGAYIDLQHVHVLVSLPARKHPSRREAGSGARRVPSEESWLHQALNWTEPIFVILPLNNTHNPHPFEWTSKNVGLDMHRIC